jgi:hypothetical protein
MAAASEWMGLMVTTTRGPAKAAMPEAESPRAAIAVTKALKTHPNLAIAPPLKDTAPM